MDQRNGQLFTFRRGQSREEVHDIIKRANEETGEPADIEAAVDYVEMRIAESSDDYLHVML